jgi:hypothetical protein
MLDNLSNMLYGSLTTTGETIMPTFDQLQERYDNQLPPDELPEPSEGQFEEAFNRLMQDDELLFDYIDAEGPDTTTIFKLIHQHGLPANHASESDGELLDQLQTTADDFIEGYRKWLGTRLADLADEVMREERDLSRIKVTP